MAFLQFFMAIWTAGGRVWLAIPFAGLAAFNRYSAYRVGHPEMNLPNFEPWWLWAFGLIAIWMIVGFALKEVHRRQVAPRLLFDEPFIWRTGIGPDAEVVIPTKMVDVISIRVRNSPVNEDGRDVTKAHCHATFKRSNGDSKAVEYLRWTEAPKPRTDETPAGMKPKIRPDMRVMDIPGNNEKFQIDFAVSNPAEPHFFGFSVQAQASGWMLPEYCLSSGSYQVDIEIQGKGLAPHAQKRLYLTRETDGAIHVTTKKME